MNINSSVSNVDMALQSKRPEGKPPGPPPGTIPKGVESAVTTLSQEDQDSVKSMLESFSKEEHDQLKAFLDEFKAEASSMSDSEIGTAFLAKLQEISGQSSSFTATTSSEHTIDTYA